MDYKKHHKITVITKKGCHICEDTIQELRDLSSRYYFEVETLDILDDPSLFEKYWIKIPVVRIDDSDVFEGEDISLPQDRREKLESALSKL